MFPALAFVFGLAAASYTLVYIPTLVLLPRLTALPLDYAVGAPFNTPQSHRHSPIAAQSLEYLVGFLNSGLFVLAGVAAAAFFNLRQLHGLKCKGAGAVGADADASDLGRCLRAGGRGAGAGGGGGGG